MKKENEKIFVCRVCGTGYDTLEEANVCESKCLKNHAKEIAEKEKAEKTEVLKQELEVLYEKEEKIEQAIENYNEELQAIIAKIDKQEDELTEIGNKIREKMIEIDDITKEREESYTLNGEDVTREEFFNGLEKMFQSLLPFN